MTFGSGAVQAGAIASSILEISNFVVRDANTGTQLTLGGPGTPGDVTVLNGTNTADLTAELNGTSSSDTDSAVITAPPGFGSIDLLQQCVGTGCPPFPENSYTGFGQTPPPGSTYSLSDMVLTGSALDASALGGPSGGADAQTRADVSIVAGGNDGSSTSNTGADVAFQFSVLQDTQVEFAFDYIISLLAYLDTTGAGAGNAQSAASWSLNLFELANPGNALNFAPDAINRTINLSVDANVPYFGSGSLVSASFLLEAGSTYQFGVSHQTRADASLAALRITEPGMLAILGVGLIALGWRRKTA